MTEKEIREGNKAIAEFMYPNRVDIDDWDKANPNWGLLTLSKEEETIPLFKKFCFQGVITEDDFAWHKSWDWLMPVVDKIGQLVINKYGVYPLIKRNYSEISFSGVSKRLIFTHKQSSKEPFRILNTYETVVKFIKWYNQQKKK